jgi:hypothetical protein
MGSADHDRGRGLGCAVGPWVGAMSLLLAAGCYAGRSDMNGARDTDDSAGDDGGSGSDGADDGVDAQGPFACDPAASVETLSMRRLSRVQYENTLRDLLEWAVPDAGASVFDEVAFLVERLPSDSRRSIDGEVHGGFRRLDQDVHQEHINAGYDVAVAVAENLTANHLAAIAGACATDADTSNDDACIDGFIRGFGERALRRPLGDDEVAFYREVYDADGLTQGTEPEAFADVIVVMLTAPQFLYLVEHADDEIDDAPGVFRLSGWELASRLSYHFWQSAPDDELLEAARSGDLLTEEGYAAQVERLFADPRTTAALEEFYAEWLWLEDLPPLDARVGTPVFDAFRGDFDPQPESTSNMVQEVLDMASWYTERGTLTDLFTSDRSFATTPDVAQIYGVAPWDGAGDPPVFPQPERAGLVARAALLATGSPNTRPIMKGVFIRKALLCDAIPPPPDNANAMPPELSPDATTREVVEALTEQEGTACAGCHAAFINPLGYATESFDALGRFRTEQTLFDEAGNVTGTRPIDSTSIPRVDPNDDRPSAGAPDLSRYLVESERVQACFARHYVRWTFGRAEDVEGDGCMLNGITSALIGDAPLGEVLRQLALRDEFKTRMIEE